MKKMFRFALVLALMLVVLTTFAQDDNNLLPGVETGTGDPETPGDVTDTEDTSGDIDPATG